MKLSNGTGNLAKLKKLDPFIQQGKYIDCMKEYFIGANKIFTVHEYIEQGKRDLYCLANIKGRFSEN